MDRMQRLQQQNLGAIGVVERICRAGCTAGVFRKDVSPVALHWQISALSFFNVANRATFAANFGDELFDEAGQALLRGNAVRSILCAVLARPETVDLP